MKKNLLMLFTLVALLTSCDKTFLYCHDYLVINGTSDSIVFYPNYTNEYGNGSDSIVLLPNEGYRTGWGYSHENYLLMTPRDSDLYVGDLRVESFGIKYQGEKFYEESFEIGSPLNTFSYVLANNTNTLGPVKESPRTVLVNTITLTYVFVLTEDYITSLERVGNGE